MKIASLKPTVSMLQGPHGTIPVTTHRIRGRALQNRNRRLLSEHPMCQKCQVMVGMEVDHRVPLWASGEDTEDNLQVLCIQCHQAKTAREASQRAGGKVGPDFGKSRKPRAPHA